MGYKVCELQPFKGLYYIYPDGKVYSLIKKRFLRGYARNKPYNYMYISLVSRAGIRKHIPLHRLVAYHFLREQPSKNHEIYHIDGDLTNNHYTNLQWITHQENMLRARKMNNWVSGRKPGSNHSKSTKDKMSESKKKKVLLFNDNEQIIYDSIEDFCTGQKTYRKAFNRCVNSCKTFNGFYVRYLTQPPKQNI